MTILYIQGNMMNEFGRANEACHCAEKSTTLKCNDCGIIYCGTCQNTHIWVSMKNGKQRVRCCPKCVGTSLQEVSFDDSTAINLALDQAIYP